MPAKTSFAKNSVLTGLLVTLLLTCFALMSEALALTPPPDGGYPGNNTAEGDGALQNLNSGVGNTAVGFQALLSTTSGRYNTGQGFRALVSNLTGEYNMATGGNALYHNLSGNLNTGYGSNTLFNNTTGSNNTALGAQSLFKNTGSNNIAVGAIAGFDLTTGSNNIDIGNQGFPGESGIIRLGTPGVHTFTILAGRVMADIGSQNTNVAVFAANANGNGSPTTHVVLIKNNQPDNSAILALQTADTSPTSADNFITFFNGSGGAMGRIEAVNATTSAYVTTGNDFAETLPITHSAQPGQAAEIVPVHDGEIGDWSKADQFMVISKQAGFVGNDPGKEVEAAGRHHRVAFIGQVPVKIRGPVSSGDYVIASPSNDGTGIAKPADKLSVSDMKRVVGRAWEGSTKEGLKEINTAVGLDQTSVFVPALQRLERDNQELQAANAALAQKLEALGTRQARLEKQFASRGVLVKN